MRCKSFLLTACTQLIIVSKIMFVRVQIKWTWLDFSFFLPGWHHVRCSFHTASRSRRRLFGRKCISLQWNWLPLTVITDKNGFAQNVFEKCCNIYDKENTDQTILFFFLAHCAWLFFSMTPNEAFENWKSETSNPSSPKSDKHRIPIGPVKEMCGDFEFWHWGLKGPWWLFSRLLCRCSK